MGLDMYLEKCSNGNEEEVGYWRKSNQIHNWFVENVQDGEDDCGTYKVGIKKLTELLKTVETVLESIQTRKAKVVTGRKCGPDTNGWEDILEDGELIIDPTVAEELLPTTSGFFFGGIQYDNFYVDDLKHTKKILEKILAEHQPYDSYYYTASW